MSLPHSVSAVPSVAAFLHLYDGVVVGGKVRTAITFKDIISNGVNGCMDIILYVYVVPLWR